MEFVERLLKKVLNLSCFILSVSVTVLMVAEIAARHFFAHAFRGLPEIYLLLVMWLYMLGACLASANRSHLRITIIDQLISSDRLKRIYDLIVAAVCFILLLFFIRWSWGLVDWGIKRPQTTPILYLPWLSSMLSIFTASVLMTLYGFRDLVHAVLSLAKKLPQHPETEQE